MSNASLEGRLAFQQDSEEVLRRREAYRGFFRLDVLTLGHRPFERAWSCEIECELFVRPPAVAVLPYDPGRGKVVLLEQFRVVDEPGRLLRGPSDHVGRVDSRAAAGVHGLGHETEDIRTHVMDLDTVIRGLDDGSIRNAATIIAVQWLELHRSVLDASWLS